MMRAIVLFAALFTATPVLAVDWCTHNVPPVEYQYEPTQRYMVAEWPHELLEGMCRGNGAMQWEPKGRHGGCWVPDPEDPNFAFIFVVAGLAPDQRECVIVHEKAHLNGWRHDRPYGNFYLDESGNYRPQRGPFRRRP